MKVLKNKNLNHESYFDSSFMSAYQLCENNFSHDELLYMLKNGNILEKQIAALKLDSINNSSELKILLENLTGCDGKIREAVAFKISSFLSELPSLRPLFAEHSADVFADASIDINANICRLIIDSASILSDFNDFSISYVNKIIKFTDEALIELDKFEFRDKKYVINKQLFKLYWCLEALSKFYNFVSVDVMENILNKCSEQNEYTIREKTAQIVNLSNNFPNIKEKLMRDENYYVRQIFKSSMHL